MSAIRQAAVASMRAIGLHLPLRDMRRDWRFRQLNRARVQVWEAEGRPMPAPDTLKYGVIRDYARRNHVRTLVETGTFYGNAIFTLRHEFAAIHSIELAPALYEQNRRELGHIKKIQLHLG